MIRLPLFAACVALSAGPAGAAPPDAAGLFPPGTLAYAELHKPAELGPQAAAALKGTAVENGLAFLAKKDAGGPSSGPQPPSERSRLASLLAPEVTNEFRKLGGAAVGLVGFTARGEPEAVLVVLTGDSAAAEAVARKLVTESPDLRKVGAVSTVAVYQRRPAVADAPPPNPVPVEPGPDNPKPDNPKKGGAQPKKPDGPKEESYEPTFAHSSGLLVVGTSKAAIAPVVTRFLGEEKDALPGTADFKAAAAEFRKPGLFFYADARSLFPKLDAAARARGDDGGPDLLAWVRLVAGPKALATVAGCAHLRDGGLAVAAGARFDPAAASPLAGAFAGPPVTAAGWRFARKPRFAATLNLPEKGRAAAVLGLLDALAKADGELGRLPSDVANDLTAKHKVDVRDELLGKVRAVTVVVPDAQELPKGATPLPLLVLHAGDATAAAALEAFVPKLVAEVAGEKEPAQPALEEVGGVTVRSLAGTGLPWKAAVHYARKDAALAVGLDRKLVAGALAAAGDNGTSPPAGAALAGEFHLGALLAALEPKPSPAGALRPAVAPLQFGGQELVPPEAVVKEVEKARLSFLAAVGGLPPGSVAVRRDGPRLHLELFLPGVQSGLKPVVAAGVAWYEKRAALSDPGRRGGPPGTLPGGPGTLPLLPPPPPIIIDE